MTTFGDMVYQVGGMPLGSGILPLMGGSGKIYWVDPANGSDGNDGLSPETALDTVGAAYAKTVDKAGDTIYLLNDGNTSGTSRESTIPLVWSNDNTHLIGLCSPVLMSPRARITPVSTAALTANPVISVTGSGNIFANLQIAHFGADTDSIAARGVDVTGDRNYFYNCHIVGIPNAHTGDEANACDLKINGGGENLFKHCTFGVDTVARSTTNACVELVGAAERNVFEDCLFVVLADNAGALFVKADGAGDIDRFVLFKNCTMINSVESTGTAMTSAVNAHDSAGGAVVFHSTQIVGATDVAAADNGNVWVDGAGGAGTGGLGIVATQ